MRAYEFDGLNFIYDSAGGRATSSPRFHDLGFGDLDDDGTTEIVCVGYVWPGMEKRSYMAVWRDTGITGSR